MRSKTFLCRYAFLYCVWCSHDWKKGNNKSCCVCQQYSFCLLYDSGSGYDAQKWWLSLVIGCVFVFSLDTRVNYCRPRWVKITILQFGELLAYLKKITFFSYAIKYLFISHCALFVTIFLTVWLECKTLCINNLKAKSRAPHVRYLSEEVSVWELSVL